jgi:toxin YoeB
MDDLAWLLDRDRKLAVRTLRLLAETARTPFDGTGKPEPLRGDLRGYWSRRINSEHRLIYTVSSERIEVLSCRSHYERR